MRRIAVLLACSGLMILGGVSGLQAAQEISQGGEVSGLTKPAQIPAKKVDLNLAGLEEIGRLPGITTQVAARIIQNRPYKKLDDLVTKKVVGKKQFAQIREYIVIGPGQK